MSHRIKKNKNGFSLKFKDLDDLKYFLISNPQITNKTEEIIKPQNIGKNSKKDRKPLPKPIFKIQMKKSDGHVHVFYEIGKDTFREELKVFDLMNVMVCGVSSNVNKKIPKIFFKSDVSQFVQKLIKQMK